MYECFFAVFPVFTFRLCIPRDKKKKMAKFTHNTHSSTATHTPPLHTLAHTPIQTPKSLTVPWLSPPRASLSLPPSSLLHLLQRHFSSRWGMDAAAQTMAKRSGKLRTRNSPRLPASKSASYFAPIRQRAPALNTDPKMAEFA